MASFSTTGSVSGNPKAGLIDRFKSQFPKNTQQFGKGTQNIVNQIFGKKQPETPVKKETISSPSGEVTTREYHAPTKQPSSGIISTTPKPVSTGTSSGMMPTKPTVGTQVQNAQNVLNAGQMTEWEKAAAENVANAKGMQNFGQFAPNAEAPFYAGLNPANEADRTRMETLITRPDLVARDQSGLYNQFANLYGTQANIGLQAAQTAAERARGAATSVLGAGAPVLGAAGQIPYNPLQGTTGQMLGGVSGAFTAGQIAGQQELGQQYAQNYSSYLQGEGIRSNISQLLDTTPLNPSDFTNINKFIQLLNGQIGNPRYQTLSNYLNEYISTLAPILGVGGDTTNLKTQIAQSMINAQASGQSIKSVLEGLDALAQSKLNQQLQAGQGGAPQTPITSSGSTGGLSGFAGGGAF